MTRGLDLWERIVHEFGDAFIVDNVPSGLLKFGLQPHDPTTESKNEICASISDDETASV